jgi:hypothetical protein
LHKAAADRLPIPTLGGADVAAGNLVRTPVAFPGSLRYPSVQSLAVDYVSDHEHEEIASTRSPAGDGTSARDGDRRRGLPRFSEHSPWPWHGCKHRVRYGFEGVWGCRMGAHGVGPETPVGAEVVHESERTRVTRLFLPGGTVIRKEPLGVGAPRRLRQELGLLGRLRGVWGVAQLLDTPKFPDSIMLADGGISLAGVPTPMNGDELIELAVWLVRAVAGMHSRGVMHRDITPANIVIGGDGRPCLVDFALARPLAEVRPEFSHHTQIVGTLAYLAPEQTGRTGRPVDHRADLYALGAVLYELATGAPPFGSGDPLRLVHAQLARVPRPPVEVNPAVPALLSAVILHLLEKEPDHRYQSADGLVYDLERFRCAQTGPAAAAVRVGERDFPVRLLPPSRLVGREAQVAALVEAFEDALAGRCRGVLISGASGVGKTALVNELRAVVTGRDG